MHYTDITIYGWRFLSEKEKNDLNLAISHEDTLRFSGYIKQFTEFSAALKKIPEGNPHHLDNKNEIIDTPKDVYKLLSIKTDNNKLDYIQVEVHETELKLNIPNSLIKSMCYEIEECLNGGYVYERYVPCLLDLGNDLSDGNIYFWGSEGKDIIYY